MRASGLVALWVLAPWAATLCSAQVPPQEGPCGPPSAPPLLPAPVELPIAVLASTVDEGAITDVAILDFDGAATLDLAVAWYATDPTTGERLRYLTLWLGNGTTSPIRWADVDLYRPSTVPPDNSVFKNGTGDIVPGDYDGDGDTDLAVLPYFSREVWFIENLGGGQYAEHFKYMGVGGSLTPPEGAAADLDGDGRMELAYLVNPTPHWSGPVHFWRTDGPISAMTRVPWNNEEGGVATTWNLGMDLLDADLDGRPDVVFTGVTQTDQTPVIVTWYALDPAAERFSAAVELGATVPGDVLAAPRAADCGHDLIVSDRELGKRLHHWRSGCAAPPDFSLARIVSGLAGSSPNRGAALAAGDLNLDGSLDLVVKQRVGDSDLAEKVQVVLRGTAMDDALYLQPGLLNAAGFEDDGSNLLLRPNNVAVGDLLGDAGPEIVAAFNPPISAGQGPTTLAVQIWLNGCMGDLNGDGSTSVADLALMLDASGCSGEALPADLNRDGCVDATDLALLLSDYGCAVSTPESGAAAP